MNSVTVVSVIRMALLTSPDDPDPLCESRNETHSIPVSSSLDVVTYIIL